MSIIRDSDAFYDFKQSSRYLNDQLKVGPRRNDLTTYIIELQRPLVKLISATSQLRECAENVPSNSGEAKKCANDLVDGLKGFADLLKKSLSALKETNYCLQGRSSRDWNGIERMWPEYRTNRGDGVFKDVVKRVTYNDYLDGKEREVWETVVSEITDAVVNLNNLACYAKQTRN